MAKQNENSLKNLENGNRFQTNDKATKEAGRKGGIASGKVRNLKARLKEWAEDGGYELMVEMAQQEIEKGNTKMWELVRDTVGEKPKDELNIEGSVPIVIKDDIKK